MSISPSANYLAGVALDRGRPAAVSGTEVLTYGDLLDRADALAAAIAQATSPQQIVAVRARPGIDLTVATLAVLACRRVLTLIDTRTPPQRAKEILDLCRPGLILDSDEGSDLAGAPSMVIATAPGLPRGGPARDPRVLAEQASHIFFTSGSTGTPKGVIGTKDNLLNFARWTHRQFDISQEDRFAQITRPSFDVILQDMFVPLTVGGCLLFPREADVYSGAAIFPFLLQSKATALNTVPSILRHWLREAGPQTPLPDMRWVFSIGEPLDAALVRRWREICGAQGEIVNLYGTTETGFESTWHVVGCDPTDPIPAGRPISRTRVHVLNEGHQPCAARVEGEIWIEIAPATLGYLDEEPDARCYTENPLTDQISPLIYRTGDRGRLVDGELIVDGRVDDEVKINGVRMQPREIALKLETHSGVRSAVVLAKTIGARKVLIGAYVPADADPGEAQLHAHLSTLLPTAFVPSAFFALADLPLNNSGKVDKAAISSLYDARHGAPPDEAPESDGMAALVAEILGGPVRMSKSFLDQGGDSLAAVSLAAGVNARLGSRLTIHDVMLAPSLASLELAARFSGEPSQVPSIIPPAVYPLSRAQLEYAALCMRTAGDWCNLAVVLREFPPGAEEQVVRTLEVLLKAHDIFRFRAADDLSQQLLEREPTCTIEWRRLSVRGGAELEHAVGEAIEELGASTLDPSRTCGRFLVLAFPDRIAVLFVGHHFFFDGVSLDLLAGAITAPLALTGGTPFCTTLGATGGEGHPPLSGEWARRPFRLSEPPGESTVTWEFAQDLPEGLYGKVRSCARMVSASPGELIGFCTAQYFSKRTGRNRALLLQPLAGRSHRNVRTIGNFARQSFLEVDRVEQPNVDALGRALGQLRTPSFLSLATPIEGPKTLLPFTSLIFNYQPTSLEDARKPTGVHVPRVRGGLWELQLVVLADQGAARLNWIYRTSSFSADEIEIIASDFLDLLAAVAGTQPSPETG